MSDTATALGNGRYVVEIAGVQHLAYAVRHVAYGVWHGGTLWVFVNGTIVVMDSGRESRTAAAHDDGAGLTAPMPARVLSVAV